MVAAAAATAAVVLVVVAVVVGEIDPRQRQVAISRSAKTFHREYFICVYASLDTANEETRGILGDDDDDDDAPRVPAPAKAKVRAVALRRTQVGICTAKTKQKVCAASARVLSNCLRDRTGEGNRERGGDRSGCQEESKDEEADEDDEDGEVACFGSEERKWCAHQCSHAIGDGGTAAPRRPPFAPAPTEGAGIAKALTSATCVGSIDSIPRPARDLGICCVVRVRVRVEVRVDSVASIPVLPLL